MLSFQMLGLTVDQTIEPYWVHLSINIAAAVAL